MLNPTPFALSLLPFALSLLPFVLSLLPFVLSRLPFVLSLSKHSSKTPSTSSGRTAGISRSQAA